MATDSISGVSSPSDIGSVKADLSIFQSGVGATQAPAASASNTDSGSSTKDIFRSVRNIISSIGNFFNSDAGKGVASIVSFFMPAATPIFNFMRSFFKF